MRVAILGAGLLARSIADVMPEATILGHDAFDIRDYDSLVAALKPIQPDVIVNTVALHSLARCEDDPSLAFEINAKGAARVASLAPTIYASTDYVFNDGGPHDEGMPGQQPRSVYGKSKLAGELETLQRGGIVVRVSGLYHHKYESHKGPSFPTQITTGFDPVKVATDQRFSPTYAPDAAERIASIALALGHVSRIDPHEDEDAWWPSGIYHAANAGSTTWAEFAQQIVEITRGRRIVIPKPQHDSLRPTNSALRSTRLPPLRHWIQALQEWSIARERV
jgi:dTDP-4-dehydrorhamnose reductase